MYQPPPPPPRHTTMWACPVDGCDYVEPGPYERAYGDGVCEKVPEHRVPLVRRRGSGG
ncbi:hypothetical protein [Lentzea sp. NPDC051838]|uniref:hypothetical protein n=1 Tax=Lentzea sp. NPDC051838 TaxID=3154849 RepID=UPI003446C96A